MAFLAALRTRLDRELATRRAEPDLRAPSTGRVAIAGVGAAVGSVLAAWLLALAGMALFTIPATFDKLRFQGYAVLTVGGVIGATIGWALVSRYAPRPGRLLTRLAVGVTLVLLLPDTWLLTQAGNPLGPVMTLVGMHIAIAAMALGVLLRAAPVTRVGRPQTGAPGGWRGPAGLESGLPEPLERI